MANIINLPDLFEWTNAVIKSKEDLIMANPDIERWISKQVRKYAINKINYDDISKFDALIQFEPEEWVLNSSDDTVFQVFDANNPEIVELTSKLDPIIDFFSSGEQPHDLSRVSIDAAFDLQEKWHKKLAKQAEKSIAKLDEDGLVEIHRYEDGFSWQMLTTADNVIYEGKKMGSCVGGKGYQNSVENKKTIIVSLRDTSNKPFVTIEIRSHVKSGHIIQIQGRANTKPHKYMDYILDFINNRNNGKKFHTIEKYWHCGGIRALGVLKEITPRGKQQFDWITLSSIPENYTFYGDIDLITVGHVNLPKNLTIIGTLYCSNSQCKLPENLNVKMSIIISDSRITQFPNNISVGRFIINNNKKYSLEQYRSEFNI